MKLDASLEYYKQCQSGGDGVRTRVWLLGGFTVEHVSDGIVREKTGGCAVLDGI